jgi:MraZ protein
VDQDTAESMQFDFTGNYNHTLDPKGRLTLPVVFREQLEQAAPAKYALALDTRCLVIYPLPVWRELRAKLDALPWNDPKAESVKRLLMSSAFNCEVDAQGRTLLPAHLRELAKIDREVSLVGKGKYVEVWDRTRWKEYSTRGQENLEDDASRLPL